MSCTLVYLLWLDTKAENKSLNTDLLSHSMQIKFFGVFFPTCFVFLHVENVPGYIMNMCWWFYRKIFKSSEKCQNMNREEYQIKEIHL